MFTNNTKSPINRHRSCASKEIGNQSHRMPSIRPSYSLHSTRPGTVIVMVAGFLVVLVGFTTLAVDLGYMYNTRAELQNAADAAAMAAAAFLSSGEPTTAEENVRAQAYKYALANKAAGKGTIIDSEADVILGRAYQDFNTGKYTFQESVYPWDAVKVIVRRSTDSA